MKVGKLFFNERGNMETVLAALVGLSPIFWGVGFALAFGVAVYAAIKILS